MKNKNLLGIRELEIPQPTLGICPPFSSTFLFIILTVMKHDIHRRNERKLRIFLL